MEWRWCLSCEMDFMITCDEPDRHYWLQRLGLFIQLLSTQKGELASLELDNVLEPQEGAKHSYGQNCGMSEVCIWLLTPAFSPLLLPSNMGLCFFFFSASPFSPGLQAANPWKLRRWKALFVLEDIQRTKRAHISHHGIVSSQRSSVHNVP